MGTLYICFFIFIKETVMWLPVCFLVFFYHFTKGNNFSDYPFASLMFSAIFTMANSLSDFLSPTERLGGYSDEPGVCSSSVHPSIRMSIRKHFCVRPIT